MPELGALLRFDGEAFHLVTVLGYSAAGIEALREPLRPEGSDVLERLVKGENIVQVADVADSAAYRAGLRGRRILVDLFGARTAIWVALRRDEALFGYFCIYRKEVRPFTDKQIALLQNFAAQAVIAMENARLLAETREALEAQQATAEVMQVINASSGDLAPVFQAMLDKAMALCGAGIGGLGTWQGERFSFVAALGVSKPFTDFIANNEVSPGPRSGFLQIARGRGYVQFEDLATSPLYAAGDPLSRAVVDIDGGRTTLTVPLVRDDEVLGVICAIRREVRPFSERQIALLKNFAGQAVVAMENARLITETREALEQQTATAEMLAGHQFVAPVTLRRYSMRCWTRRWRCAAPHLGFWLPMTGNASKRLPGAVWLPPTQSFSASRSARPRATERFAWSTARRWCISPTCARTQRLVRETRRAVP